MRIFLILSLFGTLACTEFEQSKKIVNNSSKEEIILNKKSDADIYSKDSINNKIEIKKTEALNFCKNNNLNTDLCFLLDMKIHSGKKRFFVYNFNKDLIVNSGLVAHGCGQHYWSGDESKDSPTFSNTPESHLSSLGKYKIGKRGWSNWGIHVNYLLYGLDSTNNNALNRQIVLHGWNLVTDDETYPNGTVEGWGCPAVSNHFMTYLDSTLKRQKQPVLLWMYN